MKHIIRTILNIFLGLFISIFSFSLFFIFINDPFIKYAPENTELYSIINLNQKLNQNINNDLFFNLKNIEINKILENKEFKKLQNDYMNKIGLFITSNNDFYIVLKQKPFKKNIENINTDSISKEISKYTNTSIALSSVNKNNYLFITNNVGYVNNLESNKYKFFINNTKKLIQEQEFKFLLENHLIKIYSKTDILNSYINNISGEKENVFIKDYFLSTIDIKNNTLSIKTSNIRNDKSILNSYKIDQIDNNYIELSNINSYNFINKFLENYKANDIPSSENLNFFLKNIQEQDVNLDSLKNILSNKGKLILSFKDSGFNINKIDSFLFLVKVDNFNNYLDDIRNFESIFIRQLAMNNPKIERVSLDDGTQAKEEKIDYSNLHFEVKKIENNIFDNVKFLKLKDYSIYYSMLSNEGMVVFSNSENMMNGLKSNSTNSDMFNFKNINFDIKANINENMMNIEIR